MKYLHQHKLNAFYEINLFTLKRLIFIWVLSNTHFPKWHYLCACVWVCVNVCECVWMCVSVCECVWVCVYVWDGCESVFVCVFRTFYLTHYFKSNFKKILPNVFRSKMILLKNMLYLNTKLWLRSLNVWNIWAKIQNHIFLFLSCKCNNA